MAVDKGYINLKECQDIFQWGTNSVQYTHFTEDKSYESMNRIYLTMCKKNNQEGSPNILFHSCKNLVHIMSNIDHKKEYIKFMIQDDQY